MIFLIFWALMGFIGYSIGKGKGRETEGLLLGLFLGIIGILIIALMGDKK